MTLLVPFDGSELATAALGRAVEFAELTDEPLVVLSVITEDERFARDRGWVEEGEPYDPDAVAERLEAAVREVDASVVFVGSENAGRVSTPISSVGSPVSEAPDYDVHIVRRA